MLNSDKEKNCRARGARLEVPTGDIQNSGHDECCRHLDKVEVERGGAADKKVSQQAFICEIVLKIRLIRGILGESCFLHLYFFLHLTVPISSSLLMSPWLSQNYTSFSLVLNKEIQSIEVTHISTVPNPTLIFCLQCFLLSGSSAASSAILLPLNPLFNQIPLLQESVTLQSTKSFLLQPVYVLYKKWPCIYCLGALQLLPYTAGMESMSSQKVSLQESACLPYSRSTCTNCQNPGCKSKL